MKLIDHVLHIRSLIQQAIDNRFSRLGLEAAEEKELPENASTSNREKRNKLESIIETHKQALGDDYVEARKETINECTFTGDGRQGTFPGSNPSPCGAWKPFVCA